MKQSYVVTGYDLKNERLAREYDIDEEAFWALRGRHLLRADDDGHGAIQLKADDVRLLVPADELNRFVWFVETFKKDA